MKYIISHKDKLHIIRIIAEESDGTHISNRILNEIIDITAITAKTKAEGIASIIDYYLHKYE